MGHFRLKFVESKTPAPDSVFAIRMIPLPKPIEEVEAVEAGPCHIAGPYDYVYSKNGVGNAFFEEQPKVSITSDGLFAVSSDTGGTNGGYVTVHMKTNVGWAELVYLYEPSAEVADFGHSCAIADNRIIVACWALTSSLAVFVPDLEELTWVGTTHGVSGSPIGSVAISRDGNVVVTWDSTTPNVNISTLDEDGLLTFRHTLVLTDGNVFGIAMTPDGSTIVVSTNTDVGGDMRTSAIIIKTDDHETWAVDGDPLIGSSTHATSSGVTGSGVAITPDESVVALGVTEDADWGGVIVIFQRDSDTNPYVQTSRLIPETVWGTLHLGVALAINDAGTFIAAGAPLSVNNGPDPAQGSLDNVGELFLIDGVKVAVGDTDISEFLALEGVNVNQELGQSVACDACGNTIITQSEGGNSPAPFTPEVRIFESA